MSVRPLVVKIDATPYRLDHLTNSLIEAGYQVVKAISVKEGIKLTRRCKPTIIIAVDNLKTELDSIHWLEAQHSDTESTLAMTPLLILCEPNRLNRLQVHELPDRVKVLPRTIPFEEMLFQMEQMLSVWSF